MSVQVVLIQASLKIHPIINIRFNKEKILLKY